MVLENPQIKLFYYGAMDNYYIDGRSFVFEYLNTIAAGSNFEKTLEKYQIDAVFLPKKYQLVTVLKNRPDWQTVYEDEKATVLLAR
ncbi:hypothetical protein HYZ70_03075 [Candidatus Curtissbacteria bacterium]|nr:hypothetical protein [Candidatus Curtissbacteria bacterium]